jgi:hypothetical protein
MNEDPRTPAGDFLRAVRVLDLHAGDLPRVAALLGVPWQLTEPLATPMPTPVLSTTAPAPEDIVAPPRASFAARSDMRLDPAATVVPSTLTPLTAGAISVAPAWLKQLTPLQPAAVAGPPIEAAPLLRPGQYRGILSTLLSTTGQHGPINLEQVVRAITRGDVVREIPRRPTPTMARGIQLLLDGGPAMMPFSGDLARLEHAIGRLCGDGALDVLDFSGSPLRGAGRRTDEEWRPYGTADKASAADDRSLVPPAGTRVVCVTDLGIGRGPGITPAGRQEWLRFARSLSQAGCPLVFLVPYGAARWPRVLRRALSIVQWDPATTAAVIARTVRGRRWRRRSSW